jgi:hypothetical protein
VTLTVSPRHSGWRPIWSGLLLVVAAVFILGALAREGWCADPDPLAVPTASRLYAEAASVFTSSGRDDLFGGSYVGQLGLGRWGLAVLGEASGLPGSFNGQDPKTFRSFEGYGLVSRYFFGDFRAAAIGAGVVGGSSLAFKKDNTGVVTTPHQLTLGGCLILAWPSGTVHGCGGQHQVLSGLAFFGRIRIDLTKHLSFVAKGGAGRSVAVPVGLPPKTNAWVSIGFGVLAAE